MGKQTQRKVEYHPLTLLFFQTHFGLASVPCWYKRWYELVSDITHLNTLRQGITYDGWDKELFIATRYRVSREYKISFNHIHHLLGVSMTDPSEPFGVLRDYFLQAEPKLTRTKR